MDKIIFQLSFCKSVNEISENTPNAFAHKEARNFILSHKRTRVVCLFLKIRPFLSIQITKKVAKMAQFLRILLSLYLPNPTLSMCKKNSTKSIEIQVSPTMPNNFSHKKHAASPTLPLFKTQETHIRRESFTGSPFLKIIRGLKQAVQGESLDLQRDLCLPNEV